MRGQYVRQQKEHKKIRADAILMAFATLATVVTITFLVLGVWAPEDETRERFGLTGLIFFFPAAIMWVIYGIRRA